MPTNGNSHENYVYKYLGMEHNFLIGGGYLFCKKIVRKL